MKFEDIVKKFYRTAVQYLGKEITLSSNQEFGIEEVFDEDPRKGHKFNVHYGTPETGAVVLNFIITNYHAIGVNNVTVYAPKEGESFDVADGSNLERIEKYAGIAQIMSNPNALKMIDFATEDLKQAEVVGDIEKLVQKDATHKTCSRSTKGPKKEFRQAV